MFRHAYSYKYCCFKYYFVYLQNTEDASAENLNKFGFLHPAFTIFATTKSHSHEATQRTD